MVSKNTRALLFGVAISVLALYFALRNVDFSTLRDSVFAAKPAWVVAVICAYFAHYWLKAMRWRDLLEPVRKVSVMQAYPVMMTGFFANNFLPAHLGEFVRMYIGARTFGVSNTQVLSTILLERVADFSVIALMFSVALVIGEEISDELVIAGYFLIGATMIAWVLVIAALKFEQAARRIVSWLLKPVSARLAARIEEMFMLALAAMQSLRSPRLVIRIVVLSLLQWALVGLAVFAALQSVGIEISMAAAVVTLAATVLAVSLPAAPGFFGTVQLAFVLALLPYGVSESDALAGSVIFHVVSYLFVMVAGLIALHRLDLKLADLKKTTDPAQG